MKTEQLTKAIAYAFPTSPRAEELGFAKEGCWFVKQTYNNKAYLAHNCEGFATPDDPDLIELLYEYEGALCPHFIAEGNKLALDAFRALLKRKIAYTEDGYPAVGQYVSCESPWQTVVGEVVHTSALYFWVEDGEGVVRVNPETVDWEIITKAECYEDG